MTKTNICLFVTLLTLESRVFQEPGQGGSPTALRFVSSVGGTISVESRWRIWYIEESRKTS